MRVGPFGILTIQRGQVDVQKHIAAFRSEMDDLAVNKQALFILFGGDVKRGLRAFILTMRRALIIQGAGLTQNG